VRWPRAKTGTARIVRYHLGTPRAATDSGGTKRWAWPFQSNPFGELAPDEDPEGSGEKFILNLRFPGQYYDSESGLHYNYFRDYEPQTGRYVQSDPIGLASGETSTYLYVGGNPLFYSDVKGLRRDSGRYLDLSGESCKDDTCKPPELPPCAGGYWKFRSCVEDCSGIGQTYELITASLVAAGGSKLLEGGDFGNRGSRFWRSICGFARKYLPLFTKASGIYGGGQIAFCQLLCARYPCAMELE